MTSARSPLSVSFSQTAPSTLPTSSSASHDGLYANATGTLTSDVRTQTHSGPGTLGKEATVDKAVGRGMQSNGICTSPIEMESVGEGITLKTTIPSELSRYDRKIKV